MIKRRGSKLSTKKNRQLTIHQRVKPHPAPYTASRRRTDALKHENRLDGLGNSAEAAGAREWEASEWVDGAFLSFTDTLDFQ